MRVVSLDLIRGVAVLGILAINIAGFAGPSITTLTPHWPTPSGPLGEAAYALGFVAFEGKMRALFAVLFGASVALFIQQAEARGKDGDLLQARRLGWLLLFGGLHYFLLWWGDILFAYAACGLLLLFLHRLPTAMLVGGALTMFLLLSGAGLIPALPIVGAEEAVRLDHASPEQIAAYAWYQAYLADASAAETSQYTGSYGHILFVKLRDHPFWLITGVRDGFGEFLPLMTLGLALQRCGFFSGAWPRRTMLAVGLGGTGAGLALTLGALAWLWPRHFPIAAMDLAMRHGLAIAHLATALGYAALLVLATPRLCRTRIGMRLVAAGQMAFSNYLGTSLVMTALFYGWGLGLFGQVGPVGRWGFVLLGWALMLGCSAPWLARYRRGPLEWIWRCLTEGAWLTNKR